MSFRLQIQLGVDSLLAHLGSDRFHRFCHFLLVYNTLRRLMYCTYIILVALNNVTGSGNFGLCTYVMLRRLW
jgi:hypothetical protein